MNTKKLEQAIKEAVEQDIVETIAEVDFSRYLQPKEIKGEVKRAIQQYIDQRVAEMIQVKIMQQISKYEPKLDYELQRLVFEEVSKHLKV